VNKKCGRKVFFIFFAVFLAPFSSYSYAIENTGEFYPLALSVFPIQDESHTLWDTGCEGCYQQLMLPLLFLTSPLIERHKPFKADIELGQKQFRDLSIAGGLGSTLLFIPHGEGWGQINLQDTAKRPFPVFIKTIDENEKSFKVILGDKNNTNIGFIVKPDGIYDLEGIFKGLVVEFKWQGERFRFGVVKDGEVLKITLEPLSSDLSPEVSYSKEFTLGNFEGEFKFHFAKGKPCLEIALKDGDEKAADVDINSEQVCLNLDF